MKNQFASEKWVLPMSNLSTKHRFKTKQFLALTAEIAISRYIVSIVTVKLIKEAFKKTIKIIIAYAQTHVVINTNYRDKKLL